MIHESSCEREINVNEGIHARLINSVSCVPRAMNKLPGFETKLINTSSGNARRRRREYSKDASFRVDLVAI